MKNTTQYFVLTSDKDGQFSKDIDIIDKNKIYPGSKMGQKVD